MATIQQATERRPLGTITHPLSAGRLSSLRRLRHARRLWGSQPLFAFAIMQQSYPGYTYEMFLQDLRPRTKRKKKKIKKTPLARYGRYSKIQALMSQYHLSGDQRAARAAIAMRRVITRPYRLQVTLQGTINEYTLSPMIAYQEVEKLNCEIKKAKTWQQVESMIDALRATAGYGY